LFEPLFIALFAYLAYTQHSVLVFLGFWIAQTLYNATVILMDEQEPFKGRVGLALLSPIMTPYFYVLTILNVAAAYACLWNVLALVGKRPVSGAWQPPDRIGSSLT
jgi:hypothetical protein